MSRSSGAPVVLMVAEKPSIAATIASALGGGAEASRGGISRNCPVFEFSGAFRGKPAQFRVTSVTGHVFSTDFPPELNNWDATAPAALFDARTVKVEEKGGSTSRHLQAEARGAAFLVLWLDCDREGENICFEVLDCVSASFRFDPDASRARVLRAKFSSVTAPDIEKAMRTLGVPNRAEALSVDARQELDLKVGVAFTRFQTQRFGDRYAQLNASLISYGPCQTPTLFFCVARHDAIQAFRPEAYWELRATVAGEVELLWDRGRVFDAGVGQLFWGVASGAAHAQVAECTQVDDRRVRPIGLTTVDMLKAASSRLKMGPHQAMSVAERLYLRGFTTYPRTESSAYGPNFELKLVIGLQREHPEWGHFVEDLLGEKQRFTLPRSGLDAGDHPPITPCRAATREQLSGDEWRLYSYITRRFIASLSPDALYVHHRTEFSVGSETFHSSARETIDLGWTDVMGMAGDSETRPSFTANQSVPLDMLKLHEGLTQPPGYLKESELIGIMERDGIGTDASIATHINNIQKRKYVSVEVGRVMVPSKLGITLIHGLMKIDPELCMPTIRATIEGEIKRIADGKATFESVVPNGDFSACDCPVLCSVLWAAC